MLNEDKLILLYAHIDICGGRHVCGYTCTCMYIWGETRTDTGCLSQLLSTSYFGDSLSLTVGNQELGGYMTVNPTDPYGKWDSKRMPSWPAFYMSVRGHT